LRVDVLGERRKGRDVRLCVDRTAADDAEIRAPISRRLV
jgi:hypothetical protein